MTIAPGLADDARARAGAPPALRHRLHAEPDLGLDLPRTQERVLAALAGLPLEITTGRGLNSVVAVLRGTKPGSEAGSEPGPSHPGGGVARRPAVLLRGDMDALPVVERTGR